MPLSGATCSAKLLLPLQYLFLSPETTEQESFRIIKELMSDGTIREYGVPLRLEEDFGTSPTALLLNPLVFALDIVVWLRKFTPARPYQAIRPTMDISSLFPLAQEMYLT